MAKKYDTGIKDMFQQLLDVLTNQNQQQQMISPIPQNEIVTSSTPDVAPTSQPTPAPQAKTNKDFGTWLEEDLLPLTRKEGIPDALAASQAAGEGGRNPNVPNHFGLKPGGNLASFKSLGDEVKMYANTVKNLSGGIKPDDDAMAILFRMQSGNKRYEGDNPDPYTYVKSIVGTPEFKKYSQATQKGSK